MEDFNQMFAPYMVARRTPVLHGDPLIVFVFFVLALVGGYALAYWTSGEDK